jgi:hypothetical protein
MKLQHIEDDKQNDKKELHLHLCLSSLYCSGTWYENDRKQPPTVHIFIFIFIFLSLSLSLSLSLALVSLLPSTHLHPNITSRNPFFLKN